jgi:uncharacterized membrane protein
MLGGFLSLMSAITFAYANASVRRGVLTGSVLQAVGISLPVALPFFIAAMLATGGFDLLLQFTTRAWLLFASAGIIHFAWARYCAYRATKAIGANLVAPIQQYSLIITLVLAVIWLGEALTPLRILGIALVIIGPALTFRLDKKGDAAVAPPPGDAAKSFNPSYAEGYFYALLSAIGFGITPVLVGMAFETKGLAVGIAGGFVSYMAATAAVGLILLIPRQMQDFRTIDRESARWFVISGTAICFSQMLRYMALAIAPVSVVTPIQRLSLIFRIYFGAMLNPHHEVFGGRVIWGTVISLAGAVSLSLSTDSILQLLPLPTVLESFLIWRWPQI